MTEQFAALRLAFIFLFCLVSIFSPKPVHAYNYAGSYVFAARWNEWGRYSSGGTTVYPEEFLNLNEYDVCPPKQLYTMYPSLVVAGNIQQTCANLWVAMLESSYVLGSSIALTRAKDLSEDWDINFVDPGDSGNNYWFNWYSNQYGGALSLWLNPSVLRALYPLTLSGGPHAGEAILTNNKLLALGDDKLVLLDSDGSISLYNYLGGTLYSNPTAKTFTNGAWNGQTLVSKLQYMVGYEEGNLYFVEGANTLHVYDPSLAWQRTDTVSLGNELSGYTLGDLVDNKIPGYTYIGWDVGPIVIGVTALRALDHIEVTTPTSSGIVGTATTFRVKACATSDCSTLYTRGLSGSVALSDGTSGAFSMAAGTSSATVALTVSSTPASGYVTVGYSGLSVTPIGAPKLYCGLGVAATGTSTCNYGMLPPLHHVAVTASASSGLTCTPTTFTVTACADAACSTAYTSGLTGNLTFSGTGATVKPSASIAFSIGAGASSQSINAQVTVVPATGYVTVGAGGLSQTPSGSPTVYCGLGTAASNLDSCQFNVNAAGLLLSVPNHVSESVSALSVTAVKQGTSTAACVPAFANVSKAIQLACSYTNPGSGTLPVRIGGVALNASNSASAACGSTSVYLAFDGTGLATATLQYADVGQVSLSGSYTGSGADAGLGMSGSTSFVAVPAGFGFSGVTAAPLVAGSPFSATLTARNSAGNATPNFGKETPSTADYVRIAWAKYRPSGTAAVAGTFGGTGGSSASPLGSGGFNLGSVTLGNLSWSEVGSGDLSATLVSGSYLSTGIGVSGTTGSTGAVGAFVPHHFDIDAAPSCGTFTYSGQPFTTTVTARNASGGTTFNYDGSVNTSPNQAQALTLSAVTNAASGSLTGSAIAASSFASGTATATLTPAFTFTNKLTMPMSVSLRAMDANNVSSSNGGSEPSVALRSGRLKMSNAFGAGKVSLAIPVQAQYWNGKTWVINNVDGCTVVPAASVALSNYLDAKGQATSSWSTSASGVSISSGIGTLTLGAPSSSGTGSVDVALNLGATSTDKSCLAGHPGSTGANKAWLRAQNGALNACAGVTTYDRDPSARATFGVYSPESKKLIFIQEMF
ncbi:MAG: hypothetical protein QM749_09010 [Aquabacterium sp.]